MGDALPPRPTTELRALTRQPTAIYLWGQSRPVLTRVAYALAFANDPRFAWLEIRDHGRSLDPEGPAGLGWIPPEQLYLTDEPADAAPQHAIGNLALWSVVRSDEPERVLAGLSDFLRLPPVVQELIARLGPGEGPHVVVAANADRVRPYYSQDVADVTHVLQPFLAEGISPLFTSLGPVGAGRNAFDLVFEVRAPDLGHWEVGAWVCEKAPNDSPFRAGDSVPLAELPAFAHVLSGRRGGPARGGS